MCARFKVRESDRESGVAGAVSAQCTGSEMATLAKKKNKSTKTKVEKSSGSDEEGSHDSDSEATDGTEQSGEASPGDAESSDASEVRRAGKKKQQKKKPEGKGKTAAGKRAQRLDSKGKVRKPRHRGVKPKNCVACKQHSGDDDPLDVMAKDEEVARRQQVKRDLGREAFDKLSSVPLPPVKRLKWGHPRHDCGGVEGNMCYYCRREQRCFGEYAVLDLDDLEDAMSETEGELKEMEDGGAPSFKYKFLDRRAKLIEVLHRKGLNHQLNESDFDPVVVIKMRKKRGKRHKKEGTSYLKSVFEEKFDEDKRKQIKYIEETEYNEELGKNEVWIYVYDHQYGIKRFEEYSDDEMEQETTIEDGSAFTTAKQADELFHKHANARYNFDESRKKGLTAADVGIEPGAAPAMSVTSAVATTRRLGRKLSRSLSDPRQAAPITATAVASAKAKKKRRDKEKKAKDKKKAAADVAATPLVTLGDDDDDGGVHDGCKVTDAPKTKSQSTFLKQCRLKFVECDQVLDHLKTKVKMLSDIDESRYTNSIRSLEGRKSKVIEYSFSWCKKMTTRYQHVFRAFLQFLKDYKSVKSKLGFVMKLEVRAAVTSMYDKYNKAIKELPQSDQVLTVEDFPYVLRRPQLFILGHSLMEGHSEKHAAWVGLIAATTDAAWAGQKL